MARMLQFIGQAFVYAALAVAVGYLSSRPVYQQFPEGQAQIKLSFAHGAARTEACRRLTSKEIAKLPANERRPNTCSRERVPIYVQLRVDDETLFDQKLEPTGLAGDGPARTYRKFVVAPGNHTIMARMRDSRRSEGFDYETRHETTLVAGQNLAIDFKADAGGFTFR
ncbi:MAG: hypothetical protein OEM91_08410 [Hyphomicrobiales bacterium]|nr:hypothetical protein [Hyphomicrobiales bacterium]